MLSASRSSVAIRSTVGKAENSSGLWIHSATIRISTESAIENARPMSMRNAGIGRNSTVRMKTMPTAKPTSLALARSTALTPANGQNRSPMAAPASSAPVARSGGAGKPPDAFSQLEAFVLQSFIQSMLPQNSQGFFGKGTAGEVWKSMLAEKLGAQIASSGQVGLAKRLAVGRVPPAAGALPAAGLDGGPRMSTSLMSILPYIKSSTSVSEALAIESAPATERS